MAALPTDLEFPIRGLLPKKETNVTSFLSKYPEYDGRGTIIAIFDSGVDPGAPGLQTTSDGKVKVIHRFDCSGCGDVTTTTIVQPVDGVITSLTGRKLKIPSKWSNPSGNYRIGAKHAYDLFPERLKEAMAELYKEKKWDKDHRTTVAEATRRLAEFDAKHTSPALSESDKLLKEDLDSKMEILLNHGKKFADAGPVYDCVLFHDGEHWQCCVDTSEEGDLAGCPLLAEYSRTHQHASLTKDDNLNFSVNVHDDGNLLELVGVCSSHGTHVASIAAAHFPEKPEECGVAPGAQIASFAIGDGRLGTMETGTAIVRAIIKLMELSKTQKIHVINMSYGEHAHFSDSGRVGELMNETVNKYGVVWVASAGNHGPALSTIGTPPDISQETIIGVGAYVSPDMMVAAYSMRQKLPGMAFTWSSRGPCMDGGAGVTVCAPGCAVTSVPNCTLRYSQLMNGTSMAAPHVAGAVATLLSGLLAQDLPYSPYSVKRAIENTAERLKDVEVFAQGSGLLQVDKCFEHLVAFSGAPERDIRFHVTCGAAGSKGIYIRSKRASVATSYIVSIEPSFLDAENVAAKVKIAFNIRLALVCDAPYVSYPTHLTLANGSRMFGVKVDTVGLPVGVHSTTIVAYDVDNVAKGPVFQVPITVVQPEEVTTPKHSFIYNGILFKPNTIRRHFYLVPHFAAWAVLRMASTEGGIGRFVVHTMHLLPKRSCKTLECNRTVTVNSNVESTVAFQVEAGAVLEVVIAKYWANLGDVSLDYSIAFSGVKVNQGGLTMIAAEGIHSMEVTTLQGEEIMPSVTLKNSVQILKASEGKVAALSLRDVIPPNRQIYELVLVYNFTLTKGTEVSPNLALLSHVLYESEFESQLWFLFDSNKQLMGTGDAYPSKYSVKLEKGDYVIRLQIRHEKKEILDKLTEIPILLQQKLSSAINMDVYGSYSQAVTFGKKVNVIHSTNSSPVPLFIAPLATDKFVSKSNNPTHFLTGAMTFCKDDLGKKVDTHPFKYIPHQPDKKSTNDKEKEKDDKSKYDEVKDAVRDLKISLLGKLASDAAAAEKLYEEFLVEYPTHLPLFSAYLQAIDPLDSKRAFPSLGTAQVGPEYAYLQTKIVAICDKAMAGIDENSILVHIAVKTDLRPDASKIKTTMDQQKNVFLEVLCRKGIALSRLLLLPGENLVNDKHLNEVTLIWRKLARFIDVTDSKVTTAYVMYFALWHARINKQFGRMLKYAIRLNEDKSNKDLEEKIIELCKLNEWHYLAAHIQRNLPSKFPLNYRSF